MKRLLLFILSVLMLLCAVSVALAEDPIYIGVLDAFTGDRASSGDYAKEGADLAMEHINAKGGVLGRKLELIYEDDQGNESAATNAFQKITAEHDLAAVCLSKYSSIVLAMEQFVADEGIPAICWLLPAPGNLQNAQPVL